MSRSAKLACFCEGQSTTFYSCVVSMCYSMSRKARQASPESMAEKTREGPVEFSSFFRIIKLTINAPLELNLFNIFHIMRALGLISSHPNVGSLREGVFCSFKAIFWNLICDMGESRFLRVRCFCVVHLHWRACCFNLAFEAGRACSLLVLCWTSASRADTPSVRAVRSRDDAATRCFTPSFPSASRRALEVFARTARTPLWTRGTATPVDDALL